MASGIVRKAMVYLGLTDDEYDDYDDYDDPPAPAGAPRRYDPEVSPGQVTVRPLPSTGDPSNGVTVTPRPQVVRPMATMQSAKVHVVAPAKFADAQEIGDRFRNGQPVIVNLQANDRELARRMIDFCSGVTYALAGGMERVADEVFLLTPSNVKVSEEERQRLTERGLVNP
jgi:cell division inhibitor SepF